MRYKQDDVAAFIIFTIMALAARPALADDTLGGMFTTMEGMFSGVIFLAKCGFYVAGVLMIAHSLFLFMESSDGRGTKEGRVALGRLVAGVLLCALPSVTDILMTSIGWDWTTEDACSKLQNEGYLDASVSCTSGGSASGAASAADMMKNLATNAVGPGIKLVTWIFFFTGLCIVGNSLMRFARIAAGQAQETIGGTFWVMLIGVILMNAPSLWESIAATIGVKKMASMSSTGLSYGGTTTVVGTMTGDTIKYTFYLFILFGLLAFIRGLIILKHVAERRGDASVGKGLTHIFGGIAMSNAQWTGCIFANSMGSDALQSIFSCH